MKPSSFFPPSPRSFRGRSGDLATLRALIQSNHPAKIALVGAGGSGKSTLAAALGHRLRAFFDGRIHWFRIGAWDVRTLAAMMASRFGVRAHGRDPLAQVRRFLVHAGPSLVVLDNHEDDAATAALLDGLRGASVSWVITARRSLLSGVTVFPVVPPLVTAGKSPFPRVAEITRLLRWNPVALDLADALVEAGATAAELGDHLRAKGIERVRPVEHEDDLPEVGLLVERAYQQLAPAARRMLGVLAHMGGDHMDAASLGALANAGASAPKALASLVALRLVQEPLAGRFALHATVRHAVAKRTEPMPDRLLSHYVALLEREPERGDLEQTHLFAAMDHAQAQGDLATILRVTAVADRL
jgi:hypothetical protein